MSDTSKSEQIRTLAVTAAAVVAGFAAIYVTLGGADNTRNAPLAVAPTRLEAKGPAVGSEAGRKLTVGEMTTFVFKPAPEAIADVAFKGRSGEELSLKNWAGRVVLVNLWATWCAPCRKEMPSLSRLQKDLGSKDFEVVALAVDRAGAETAGKFLASVDASELKLYVDATARGASALKAVGMPTTILLDRQGREIGRLTGPAEWDSEEAKRLIKSVF
jgi:thiol-disulfide isomerase/thioredoxin